MIEDFFSTVLFYINMKWIVFLLLYLSVVIGLIVVSNMDNIFFMKNKQGGLPWRSYYIDIVRKYEKSALIDVWDEYQLYPSNVFAYFFKKNEWLYVLYKSVVRTGENIRYYLFFLLVFKINYILIYYFIVRMDKSEDGYLGGALSVLVIAVSLYLIVNCYCKFRSYFNLNIVLGESVYSVSRKTVFKTFVNKMDINRIKSISIVPRYTFMDFRACDLLLCGDDELVLKNCINFEYNLASLLRVNNNIEIVLPSKKRLYYKRMLSGLVSNGFEVNYK